MKSTPTWLKWACVIVGGWFLIGGIGYAGFTLFVDWKLWQAAQAKHQAFSAAFNSQVIAAMLGQLTGAIVGSLLGYKALTFGLKALKSPAAGAAMPQAQAVAAAARPVRRARARRWHSSNVLELGASFRQLWTFDAGRNGFSLNRELTLPVDGPLPAGFVGRDWKTLFQPKLNIALLPVERVFLRVIQLPVSEFEETLSMVELQLEKLSPLPVGQVVWSIQILPHTVDNLHTVVVIIAARDAVEEYLGKLEKQGYIADRLELPILDQLLATPITGDGAWIFPGNAGTDYTALVAWWYGGVLRNLGLVHVPAVENCAELLKEQMTQMAWAGELDGWLTSPPNWHLVADENMAASWQPMFRAWLGQPAEVIVPLSPAELAALTANRAGRAEERANILPVEYSDRYRREFVDRLWMRGLGTVLTVYVFGVIIYMAALQIFTMKAKGIEGQANGLFTAYTNTVKMEKQLQILEERHNLRFAALDCWKVTAQNLPEGFTVTGLDFKNGAITVQGTAPIEAGRVVNEFGDSMRKATLDGHQFFTDFIPGASVIRGQALEWRFTGTIARVEGGGE